jgi:hypothetical protein
VNPEIADPATNSEFEVSRRLTKLIVFESKTYLIGSKFMII